jgi:integrase
MAKKNLKTTTSGLPWDTMLGLLHKLKKDGNLRGYLLISTGSYFGLRAKDLLNLQWNDVLEKDVIDVIESKTKKTRRITLNSSLKEVFNEVYNQLLKSGQVELRSYLFCNRNGGKLTIQYVNRILHQIFIKYHIKVQNGSTHTLRKTFGKRVWDMDNQSERSLIYLSEIFSHANISTTKRYIGIIEKDIENIYLSL